MKTNKITARQSFDSTNQTTLQFATVAEATAWVEREMQNHRLATYSIYRNSTSRLLRQWEGGKLTISDLKRYDILNGADDGLTTVTAKSAKAAMEIWRTKLYYKCPEARGLHAVRCDQ